MINKKSSATYVIGHINPDTDSIAAAMGYAWFLQEKTGEPVLAARAGQLNPQTTWVLNKLQVEAPTLLPDASPRFDSICQRLDSITPERPLTEAWAIANRTGGIVPVLKEDGRPYGLITGMSLFGLLREGVSAKADLQKVTMADVMDRQCADAADTNVPKFKVGMRVRDAIPKILHEERNEFLIVDDNGRYAGVCRQRDALNPPRIKVILVDHNEPAQALGALDEADLIEILDHHRLGNSTTRTPIRFTVDVVGSTSTLVFENISEMGMSAPPQLAGLLLAGLISDTLLLTSPTTTPRDHVAAEKLGRWAFAAGSPLEGETLQSYGEQVLEAGASLASRTPEEIVSTDFKLYEAGGMNFGVAQAEVVNRSQVKEHLSALKEALYSLRDSKGLDFVVLMITDVVRSSSYLLLTNDVPQLSDLPYPRRKDGTLNAEGVVSRKLQLLPTLLGALEG
ncbi:MAG: DHHA2 domain-containing protein [Chloroflexota bacterium]